MTKESCCSLRAPGNRTHKLGEEGEKAGRQGGSEGCPSAPVTRELGEGEGELTNAGRLQRGRLEWFDEFRLPVFPQWVRNGRLYREVVSGG